MNRILDPKMSEEEKRAIRRQISTIIQPQGVSFGKKKLMEDMKRKLESGMLTYEDAEPVQAHAPRVGVDMIPLPRRGFFGRIKDCVFGPMMKPQAVMVLDKKDQEGLRKQLEDLRRDGLEACGLTEEDVKEWFQKLTDKEYEV